MATDEQKYLDKIWNAAAEGKITQSQAMSLENMLSTAASNKGDLGATGRNVLNENFRLAVSSNASTPSPNPSPVPLPSPPTGGGSEGSGGGTTTPIPRRRFPRISATPISPPSPPPLPTTKEVKQATPDLIIFDEQIDPEFLTQTFFQEFGGTELINISRSDLIDGVDVTYSPIVNLSNLRQTFNPNNIIAIGAFQENPTKYGIDLISRGIINPYFDNDGNLVIEIEDVRQDESIEVQIAVNGTINVIEL